jgi:hypothetical protein
MTEPIARKVTRWVCPFCSRGRAKRAATLEHMTRCYRNPAARACLTCSLYVPPSGDGIIEPFSPEYCQTGLNMPERGVNVHCPLHEHDKEP